MSLFSTLQSVFGGGEWSSLNSDQFATLIADCEKIKADLDKLDLNVDQLYAKKCRKPTADFLALMKVGDWLTAKEALDWGFVDEITDLADEPALKFTYALASAMASEGMPIPNIPVAESDREGLFGKFLNAIASLFRTPSNSISTAMIKTYTFLSAILADKPLTVSNGTASVTVEQFDAIESAFTDKDVDPDAPICIGMDYNANINWIVAGQPRDRRLNIIKSFYVKFERKIPALVEDFCRYYAEHRNKTVVYYYDTTALG